MNDPEMELWQKEWSKVNGSAAVPLPDEIVAAAVRYQRRSNLALAANIIFAMLLLAGSLMMAKRTHSREIVLWAVCVWMTTLIASYLALERWRKSRVDPIESVADYAHFHRKRAIADQWMVRTGVVLLCVQDAIACVWLTTDLFRIRISLSRFGMAMAVLLVISLLWAYLFRRMWRRAAVILETNVAENDEPEAD
jgi:hypothetical protein